MLFLKHNRMLRCSLKANLEDITKKLILRHYLKKVSGCTYQKLKTFQSAQSANRILPFNNRPLPSSQSLHNRKQFYVSIAYPNLLRCTGVRLSLDIIVALRAVLLRSAPFYVRLVSVSLLDQDIPQSHALSTDFGGTDSIGHN